MINPLNQNPMQMNQFNQMNFNNQMGMNNFMNMGNIFNDTNAFKIKNLIKPYEDKIKELEEKLREKEFEIACLKNKLNENNGNMDENIMNPMNQMMVNPMMNMMKSGNCDEILEIYFQKDGNLKEKIRSSFDELIISVINKYCKKNGIDKDAFIFNFKGKKLNENLTVAESGINNNSKINVIKKYDLKNSDLKDININKNNKFIYTFSFEDWLGLKINVFCRDDEILKDVIIEYCNKKGLLFDKILLNEYYFLFNGGKIPIGDFNLTMKNFFSKYHYFGGPILKIYVFNTQNLIGN